MGRSDSFTSTVSSSLYVTFRVILTAWRDCRHLTRDAEAQELRGQLDRFETLLNALGSGGIPSNSTEDDGNGASSSRGGGLGAAMGALMGAAGNSNAANGGDGGNHRSLSQLQVRRLLGLSNM